MSCPKIPEVNQINKPNYTEKSHLLTFPGGPLEAVCYHQSICRTRHLLGQTHLVQTMPGSKEYHSMVSRDAAREEETYTSETSSRSLQRKFSLLLPLQYNHFVMWTMSSTVYIYKELCVGGSKQKKWSYKHKCSILGSYRTL